MSLLYLCSVLRASLASHCFGKNTRSRTKWFRFSSHCQWVKTLEITISLRVSLSNWPPGLLRKTKKHLISPSMCPLLGQYAALSALALKMLTLDSTYASGRAESVTQVYTLKNIWFEDDLIRIIYDYN